MKKAGSIIMLFSLCFLQVCAPLSFNTRNVDLPEDLIYQNRLLLIFTPKQDLPIYQREEEMYVEQVEGLASRDVQVYRLFPKSGLNPENKRLNPALVLNLRDKHGVARDEFVNILVDKDGEAKLRKKGILPPQDLFAFIDSLYVQKPSEIEIRKD